MARARAGLTLLLLTAVAGPAGADTMAPGAPTAAFSIAPWLTGLDQVTDFRFLPDGRTVIIEKGGAVKVRTAAGTVVTAFDLPVDSGSEKGGLGVEVHPGFASNKTLFFYYSASGSAGGTSTNKHRIVAKTLGDDNMLAAAETVLVSGLRGPANHDGGSLALSADGQYLYIGVGDTGCNSGKAPEPPYTPTNFFATCLTNGNGKILRVALDGSIPADNPLVGKTAVTACGSSCGENISSTGTAPPRADLWAWGFRNPFRSWVDPVTGNLWVGDVGEVTYEEIDVVKGGGHHGWPWREGFHGWPVSQCATATDTGDCVEPAYNCKHGSGTATEDGGCKSITGGLIVDSCTWPAAFRGKYVFADNANGSMWTLDVNPARDGVVTTSRADFADIDDAPAGPVAIHVGPDGDLYVAVLTGRIIRISPISPEVCGSDGPVDVSVDAPVDLPIDLPIDAPVDAPIDPPIDSPVDPTVDAPFEPAAEAPVDAGVDGPAEAKADATPEAAKDASADSGDGGSGDTVGAGDKNDAAADAATGTDARDGGAPDGRLDSGGQGDAGPGGSASGCGCDLGSSNPASPAAALLVSGLVLAFRRRRGLRHNR